MLNYVSLLVLPKSFLTFMNMILSGWLMIACWLALAVKVKTFMNITKKNPVRSWLTSIRWENDPFLLT